MVSKANRIEHSMKVNNSVIIFCSLILRVDGVGFQDESSQSTESCNICFE